MSQLRIPELRLTSAVLTLPPSVNEENQDDNNNSGSQNDNSQPTLPYILAPLLTAPNCRPPRRRHSWICG